MDVFSAPGWDAWFQAQHRRLAGFVCRHSSKRDSVAWAWLLNVIGLGAWVVLAVGRDLASPRTASHVFVVFWLGWAIANYRVDRRHFGVIRNYADRLAEGGDPTLTLEESRSVRWVISVRRTLWFWVVFGVLLAALVQDRVFLLLNVALLLIFTAFHWVTAFEQPGKRVHVLAPVPRTA